MAGRLKEKKDMLRLGLCCLFYREPIRFHNTTVTAMLRLKRPTALKKISGLCLANAESLYKALTYCAAHGIRAFRINSQILPVKTHHQAGYEIESLPESKEIVRRFKACGRLAKEKDIRLSFHPDQFVVLSSADRGVTGRSVRELEYQAQVSEWVGADVINIHAGGAYGDKPAALSRVRKNIKSLSKRVRSRLTLENDDRTYGPADLLPLCQNLGVPFVYDIHHHRCLPDGMTEKQATRLALKTWNREPLFHISSPREGWHSQNPAFHHDYVNVKDFPRFWRGLDITVEVEAKAKELAVLKLKKDLKIR